MDIQCVNPVVGQLELMSIPNEPAPHMVPLVRPDHQTSPDYPVFFSSERPFFHETSGGFQVRQETIDRTKEA